jgi:hypothetical protein
MVSPKWRNTNKIAVALGVLLRSVIYCDYASQVVTSPLDLGQALVMLPSVGLDVTPMRATVSCPDEGRLELKDLLTDSICIRLCGRRPDGDLKTLCYMSKEFTEMRAPVDEVVPDLMVAWTSKLSLCCEDQSLIKIEN